MELLVCLCDSLDFTPNNCFLLFLIVGYSLLSQPMKPFQHISFQFVKYGQNVRYSVGRALKELFRVNIKQKYGGWISRLDSDDAILGLYEVHLFSRSDDLRTDRKFTDLWIFMHDVLEVEINSVSTGLMSDVEADPNFQNKFVLNFSHNQPEQWSNAPEVDDTASIFSIESVDYVT